MLGTGVFQVAHDTLYLKALPALYLYKGQSRLQLILAHTRAGKDELFSVPCMVLLRSGEALGLTKEI